MERQGEIDWMDNLVVRRIRARSPIRRLRQEVEGKHGRGERMECRYGLEIFGTAYIWQCDASSVYAGARHSNPSRSLHGVLTCVEGVTALTTVIGRPEPRAPHVQ